MRFGLTAFCTENTLDPASLATDVEAAGILLLLFPDHTHIPVSRRSPFPGGTELPEHYKRTYDPLVACAFAAAATTRLRVGVGVCLVPARDPIVLAKQVASLDVLSNGRLVLGVGAGWNREEVEDHGVAGPQRWAVMRERVLAMREIWTTDTPSFSGEYVRFEPMWSWPKPRQRPYPPILVGGHGEKVLQRVVEYGDEWLAMAVPGVPPLRERMAELAALAHGAGRTRPTVSVQLYGTPPDERLIEKYVDAGVDRIDFSLAHGRPAEQRADLDVLAAVVDRWTT
jgi:probable F420-dependent oxidoreductase